jgi:dUTP pyrophosphatase
MEFSTKVRIKVKRLRPEAKLPTKGSKGAACFDLYCAEKMKCIYQSPVKVSTGYAFEIPEGYCGKVYPRSSSTMKGLVIPPLIVESDFRGELFIPVIYAHYSGKPDHVVKPGDRIAQIAIEPVIPAEFEEAEALSETERGDKGYGSTGR